jgi:hypothetical protein
VWSALFRSCASALETFWPLVTSLRSVWGSDIFSLGRIEIGMSHFQLQSNQELRNCLDTSRHDVIVRCFCSTLGLCGKNLAQIFLFRKPSWKVWRIVSLVMFNSSYIFLKPIDDLASQYHRHFLFRLHFLTLKETAFESSRRSCRSSWNRWKHSNTLLSLTASSP